MSTHTPPASAEIEYPDSDGKPMADNTLQYRWIVTIQSGLDLMYRDAPDVLVVGDLLWYPVEGDNKTRMAPDVMVVFGRPQGDRGSYKQWVEDHIAPQVVFEILSPGNRPSEMVKKRAFYERYGVEEYYVYDPEPGRVALWGWLRDGAVLRPIQSMRGWVSPRLGVRFELGEELELFDPDGQPFLPVREIGRQRLEFRRGMWQERARADQAAARAEEERARAEEERARAERFMAKLREMGVDPDDVK